MNEVLQAVGVDDDDREPDPAIDDDDTAADEADDVPGNDA